MTIWVDYASRITNTFKAEECALLIIDVQASFCSPTGRTGRKHSNTQMQALPAKINTFTQTFRDMGGLPIYIKSVPSDDLNSENDKWINQLKGVTRPATKDDPELDFYGLDIPKNAIIIEKQGDGFSHSNLKETLETHNIKTVLTCGVRTEICVRRTSERAATEGFMTFVLKDLCATRDANQDHAEQALMFLNAYTGIVIKSEQIKKLLT